MPMLTRLAHLKAGDADVMRYGYSGEVYHKGTVVYVPAEPRAEPSRLPCGYCGSHPKPNEWDCRNCGAPRKDDA